MSILNYILIWFGMMTSGFMIGIGSETSKLFFNKYLQHKIINTCQKIKEVK